VALGEGQGTQRSGDVHRFAFVTVFTFRAEQICRVESYVVPLP
jgi:ketosteroid isomerase-like protein